MGFALFILLNAVLFIRPAEVVPALLGLPIYEVIILACLTASFPAVVNQLRPRALGGQPLTVCVLGILLAIVLSHLSHLFLWGARQTGVDFLKVALYYLLLLANVNSLDRLRRFLIWLAAFILVLTGLALLQYHDAIQIPGLETLQQREVDEETGEVTLTPRLRSTGIYNDPNDLSLILVMGVVVCLYWVGNARRVLLRWLWLVPLGPLGYAIALTRSRGGFMAFMAALLTLFQARYGSKKTIALASGALLALCTLLAGRQTRLSTSETTARERIEKWSEGMMLFREAPLFGIGAGEFAERVGLVAHNSYIHCYAELGMFGGTLFLGAFAGAVWTLQRSPAGQAQGLDPGVRHVRPYLLAMIAGYGTGLLTLSRPYVAPTYTVLALSAVYLRLAARRLRWPVLRFDWRFLRRLALISPAFVLTAYVFVRVFAPTP